MSTFTDVQEMHDAADLPRPPAPGIGHIPDSPDAHLAALHLRIAAERAETASLYNGDNVALRRIRLLTEELHETVKAILAGDLVGTADGLADISYVNAGTADEFGIDLDAVHDIVHAANMAKRNPETGKFDRDAANKIIKPEHWVAPEAKIELLLANAGGGR